MKLALVIAVACLLCMARPSTSLVPSSSLCTGSYQQSSSRPGKGPITSAPGTACVPYEGKICHYDKGRWGESWCKTEDKWGAECVQCSDTIQARRKPSKKSKPCRGKNGKKYNLGKGYVDQELGVHFKCVKKKKKFFMKETLIQYGCIDVKPSDRVECGFGGITKSGCENKGCCFDDSIQNTPWCFQEPTDSSTTDSTSGETTTTDSGETTETNSGETTASVSSETTSTDSGETTATDSGETTATDSGETTATDSGETTAEDTDGTTANSLNHPPGR